MYLVTGGTGFIGRNLITCLMEREGTIYVLVRSASKAKIDDLRERVGDEDGRIVPVKGDLLKSKLGISKKDLAALEGKVKHVFHLAAIYDIENENDDEQIKANVEGTRNAVAAAEALGAECFHHTSSIAAAGLYSGYWREDMFSEWEPNEHPYFRTKHDSEQIVRESCKIPWRIYRPGIVVGHSETGEIDKIDGPYFYFKLIQKIRRLMPQWVSLIGLEGGFMNIVPVDYVASAMDHIAHKGGLDGRAFHLTNPDHHRIGEVLNIFADAAHAPVFGLRIDARLFEFIPKAIRHGITNLPPIKSMGESVLSDMEIPKQTLKFIKYPTRFDNRDTEAALKGSGIACPPLKSYAGTIWDFWERNLDPDLFRVRSLHNAVSGKVVLITGATSGIGLATAEKVAAAGAKTVIAARTPEDLAEVKAQLEAKGGEVYAYRADLADMESIDQIIADVEKDLGGIDVLVNNAGRSIRRSVALSYDRFHDFERTMQLNYFGCLRLILRALPGMSERKGGQIINVLSIGCQVNQPRFSAYVASKSALDAFSRCAAPEFAHKNIRFTNIYMPLVKTPMIAPTKLYDHVPTLNPDQAADLICKGIVQKPTQISTRLGTIMQALWAVSPKAMNALSNNVFRLFNDSAAAKGGPQKQVEEKPSSEAVAFAALTKGVHW